MRVPVAAIRVGSLSLVICLFASMATGQEKSGSLQGTISDDTNAVLPGVSVTLINKSTHRIFSAAAGPYGDYLVRDVAPGQYSVTFELAGFTRTEFPEIGILVGQNLRLDAKMKPGAITTTVQVTGVAPLMDTQNSSAISHVPEEEFDALPKDRTFQQLAILAPGVNVGDLEGGIQINGASGAENTYLIDGVATQSAIDGLSRQNAVFEYVQEIQIQTTGVEADYGGTPGGIISAVTRSGGNQFHGNIWLYHSGSGMSSAPPARLVLNPNDNRTVGFYQDKKNNFHANETGFSLGGPIRKNQLYFYTAWSPRWTQQDQLYHFSGGETGTIRRTQTFMSGFNKISFEPRPRLRANFSWLWSPSKGKGTLPAYNSSCANCISSSLAANSVNKNLGYFNPQSSYEFSLDLPLSHNVVFSSRTGYFWDDYKDSGVPTITSVQYQAPAVGPLVPPSLQGGVGFENVPPTFDHEHDLVARASSRFDLSIIGRLAGSHNVKMGFGIDKTVNNVNSFYPGGYVYIWWDSAFTSPIASVPDRGTYGYYEVSDFRTLGSTGASTKSWYVQDNWRLSQRLTLNVGVRMENEQVPSFRRDIRPTAIDFGWGDKVAPRVGGAFDFFGNGKLKLYGSWGRYFDPVRYQLARDYFGGKIWRTYYRSLDTPNVFDLSLNNLPGRDLWNPSVPGAFRERSSAAAGLNSIAPGLKPMSQDQSSFGADYQWNPRTTIGAQYIHQKLRRAIEDLIVPFNGNSAYIFANPGEGIAVSDPAVTTLTAKPLNYPKPVRTYDAVEFKISKRLASHWFGNFSYTWSRLYGNYSGTASSDEILTPTTGISYATAQQAAGSIAHPARNATLGWDLDEVLFDSKGHLDTRGRLATDRPNVLKVNGSYEFDFHHLGKTSIGAFEYLGSGTPLSTVVETLNHVAVLVNGRGDMGRTPMRNYTDLQVAHTLSLTENQKVRIELNVLNAFNRKTALHRFVSLNRGNPEVPVDTSAIVLSSTDLRKGYDYNALLHATPDGANAYDPRYGMVDLYSEGISARFGIKWSF